MTTDIFAILFGLNLVVFLGAVFMHLLHRNVSVIRLYMLQSLSVGSFLALIGFVNGAWELLAIAVVTVAVKALIAPTFFFGLMRRFKLERTANNYLSHPFTLILIAAIVIFSYSGFSAALAPLSPALAPLLPLNWATIFISIFLMYNRRGAFGQIVGVLSLENGIVAMAAVLGIAQPLSLELGVVFDLVVWIVVANLFIAMLHRQFGTLNVTEMRKLVEEE